MACRDVYETTKNNTIETNLSKTVEMQAPETMRLFFGVDSSVQADDVLQNNLTEFEWVIRNKIYPNFWGRNITGENCLTKEEIRFLHEKGCKIAAIHSNTDPKETEEQGKIQAKKLAIAAMELDIPESTAIFLEVEDNTNTTSDYMRGFAQGLLSEGYTPGFKANTDAAYGFDREYSRGLQTNREVFEKCLVWAVAPVLIEYNRTTTTHLIHPDNWMPYAPSGIVRNDIAIWQYGQECHPINDNADKETSFNVSLVKDEKIIVDRMF